VNKEINVEDTIKEGDILCFSLEDFKNFSADIYEKYKDLKDVEISIEPDMYYEYSESYTNVRINVSYCRTQTKSEKEIEDIEEEKSYELSNIIPAYMAKVGIPNNMGTVIFKDLLYKNKLYCSKDDYELFKNDFKRTI